jgi:hypothetical protein
MIPVVLLIILIRAGGRNILVLTGRLIVGFVAVEPKVVVMVIVVVVTKFVVMVVVMNVVIIN